MNWVDPIRDSMKIIEIENLLKSSSPRNYLLFAFGIRVALRISDLLSLQVKDVLTASGDIKDSIIVIEKKTGKRRIIKLNNPAKEAIAWYFDRTNNTDANSYLFYSQKGGALSRFQALRLIKNWCKQVGVDGIIGTHSLRKTWAYQVWKKGGDVSVIRKALGHSKEEITLRYIGIPASDVADLYDLMD